MLASRLLPLALGIFVALGACKKEAPTKAPQREGAQPGPPSDLEVSLPEPEALTRSVQPRKRPAPAPVTGLDDGRKALRHGNPEGALKALSAHLKQKPKDVDARVDLIRAQLAVGTYADAAQTAADGLKGGGKKADRRLRIAQTRVAMRRGETDSAKTQLQALIKDKPKDLLAQGLLLRVLQERGEGEDPEAQALMDNLYDAYDAGEVKSAEDLYAVALATLASGTTGGFKDANGVLGDAEQLAPAKDGSWIADEILLLRANMFLEKYAGDEAAQTLQLLLQRDPWHPDALAGMARVAVDGLNFAGASKAAMEALQVNPDHPGAQAALARVALIEGRRDEARERVEDHVLKVNPRHPEGLAVLAARAVADAKLTRYQEVEALALKQNPKNAEFFRHLADVLAFLHHYRFADEVLARAVTIVPSDAGVQSAYGLNLLRVGKEEAGLKALKKAWKRDRFNVRTDNLLRLYEENIARDYAEVKAGNITLRLPKKDLEFVKPRLVAAVNRARKALDKAYGTKVGALRLEFFARHDEFSIRTIGVPSLGAAAVCFGDVITFVGPYHGTHNIEGVIWHELAHVYAIRASNSRVPRWFTEGLSEWESEVADPAWARESAELLASVRRAGRLRKLGDIELAFIRADSPQMMEAAYSLAAYAMRWLGERYGRDKLIAMLRGYGEGKSTEQVTQEVLGLSLTQLEGEFETWLTGALEAKITGWHPSPDPAKRDARDREFAAAVGLIQEKKLDEAIAALQTFIKKSADGYTPRLLLARLLAEKNQLAEAKKHARKAVAFHPEALDPLILLTEIADRDLDLKLEIEVLRQALAIDGNSFDPAARLVALATVTGDKKLRATALARAAAIAPVHPVVLAAEAFDLAKSDPAGAKLRLNRAAEFLADGKGPADTYVLAALAADALGDRARAAVWAARARKDPKLVAPARKALKGL